MAGGPVARTVTASLALRSALSSWRRPRVVEAGVAGGPGGQGGDRVAGPGLAQRPSSAATARGSSRLAWAAARVARTVTASLAPASRSAPSSSATARGLSRLAWPAGSRASRVCTASLAPARAAPPAARRRPPGLSRLAWPAARVARVATASLAPAEFQLLQQLGDGQRVVEADVAGGVAGQQGMHRVAGPGPPQRPQQLGDGLRVVEADVARGPGSQDGDRVPDPAVVQRRAQVFGADGARRSGESGRWTRPWRPTAAPPAARRRLGYRG